jgi:hypothetical protein
MYCFGELSRCIMIDAGCKPYMLLKAWTSVCLMLFKLFHVSFFFSFVWGVGAIDFLRWILSFFNLKNENWPTKRFF